MIRHFYRYRQRYLGALYLLIVQFLVAVSAFLVIRANYALFLHEESDIIEVHDVVAFTWVTTKEFRTPQWFSRHYSWVFGSMISEQRLIGAEQWMLNHTYALVHQVSLSMEVITRYYLARYYFDQGFIDGYMFKYFLTHTDRDINTILTQWSVLYPLLGRPIPEWTVPLSVIANINETKALIDSQSYDAIFEHISSLQRSIDTIFSTHRSQVIFTDFMKSPEFAYLYDKIHIDSLWLYRHHIDHFARLFEIEPALIKAAIMTEQLRWFFTYRWMVKQLIWTQRYMMVMQQASRGIGGVKEKTARDVEEYVRQYRPELWSQTFAYLDGATDRSQRRFAAMTNNQNYAHQIAYVAWTLAMYRDQWKREGILLDQAPGVLLTLYNIWARTPQPNPQMGGAVLRIWWQRMTFAEVWLMMYALFAIYP